MRLIKSVRNVFQVARVYRDAENDCYLVRYFVAGVEHKDASYETSDKDDAIGTAMHMTGYSAVMYTEPMPYVYTGYHVVILSETNDDIKLTVFEGEWEECISFVRENAKMRVIPKHA